MTKEGTSTGRVTPYELAMLAAKIVPGYCTGNPEKAIAVAQSLLFHAQNALERKEAEDRKNEEEWEAWQKEQGETRVDWAYGVKKITNERRRDRAIKKFTQFMKHEPLEGARNLDHYRHDGFTLDDAFYFADRFDDWKKQPKRKKGKQGRKISDYDGRLRTELVGLVPKKPRKRA
jgi:hypothetical protein